MISKAPELKCSPKYVQFAKLTITAAEHQTTFILAIESSIVQIRLQGSRLKN